MEKIKILNLEIEDLENAGCNNGNYPTWTGTSAETGQKISGVTCRCGSGCSNTDRIEWEGFVDSPAYLVIDEVEEN